MRATSFLLSLVMMVSSCSLEIFDNSDTDSGNGDAPGTDLFNPEPIITPSFVESAFCTGEFGDLPEIVLYFHGNARELCNLPPVSDLRGIQFASLNIASLASMTTGSNTEHVTAQAANAGFSPYFSHEVRNKHVYRAMRSLYHLVAADVPPGRYEVPNNCWANDDKDRVHEDCDNAARAKHARFVSAYNEWAKLTIDERLPYIGISIIDWNKSSIHLAHYDLAYQKRRAEKRAKRRRNIGIFVAVVLTVATAGTGASLGASFGASLSQVAAGAGASMATAGVAFNAGVALGGMVVASGIGAFTTFLVTGDFKASMKALTSVFGGQLEDAIQAYIGNMIGLPPSVINAAVESFKEGELEGLEAVGLGIVGTYGHDFLTSLVDEEDEIKGFDVYLIGLADAIEANEDPENLKNAMSKYTANYLGGYLASYLHISSPRGLRLIENLINEGLSKGSIEAESLRNVLVVEVKTQLDAVPDYIKSKLGGRDNTEGLLSDIAAKSLLKFPKDFDRAKDKVRGFIRGLSEKYNFDLDIDYEPSEEVKNLIAHLKENGPSQASVESYLDQHHLLENLVVTYNSDTVAENGILTAMDYAENHGLNSEIIETTLMTDVVDVVSHAAIADEIANVFGGDDMVVAEFQTAFATRIAYHRNRDRDRTTEELVELALTDVEDYGDKFAQGYVGGYDAAMIGYTLGDNVQTFLTDLEELYTNDNERLAITYFKDNLLRPLGKSRIDLDSFDDEEIMDVIQAGINVKRSRGNPPQMIDAMGSALTFYGRQNLCNFCN